MKRTILSKRLLTLSINLCIGLLASSYATSQDVVKHFPIAANGYLILDRSNHPQLDHWECTIYKHVLDQSGTFTSSVWMDVTTSEDFVFVTDDIADIDASGIYLMDIKGYDENNNEIASASNVSPLNSAIGIEIITAPVGEVPVEKCKKTCNGKVYSGGNGFPADQFAYAWDATLYEYEVNGGTYMRVEDANYDDGSGNLVPYYAYYDQANFNQWCTGMECVHDGFNVIHGLDGSQANYVSLTGYPLTGTVAAVRKTARQWGQGGGLRAPEFVPQSPISYSTFAYTSASVCGNPRSWFENQINIYGDFNPSTGVNIPPLECLQAVGSVPPTPGTKHKWMLAWLKHRQEELIQFPFPPANPPGPDPMDNIWEILQEAEDEAEESMEGLVQSLTPYGPGGVDENIGQYINKIIITDMLGTGAPTTINLHSLYGADGSLTAPSNTLPAGLYSLTLAYTNGEIRTKVVEASTGIDFTYEQSDLVDITETPSPITQNSITIQFTPRLTTAVSYELLDFTGNVLFSSSYNLVKDTPQTINETYPPAMGTGIVFHKYTFPDGSSHVSESVVY